MDHKNRMDQIRCPVTYAINMIGGKWHLPIIWTLSRCGVLRYNELKRKLSGVTNMMLTQSLKELEGYGLIHRVQFPEIPPRVEYSLAEAGLELLPAIDELAKWGARQMAANRGTGQTQEEVR